MDDRPENTPNAWNRGFWLPPEPRPIERPSNDTLRFTVGGTRSQFQHPPDPPHTCCMNDNMGPTREIEKILLLFDEQYEDLYCFLRRYTPPRESEDLCQQVFLELCNIPESENDFA